MVYVYSSTLIFLNYLLKLSVHESQGLKAVSLYSIQYCLYSRYSTSSESYQLLISYHSIEKNNYKSILQLSKFELRDFQGQTKVIFIPIYFPIA